MELLTLIIGGGIGVVVLCGIFAWSLARATTVAS